VTEYQAQVLEGTQGNRFVAIFPGDVTKVVLDGRQLKAHAVYLSQYPLLPYKRVQENIADQLQIPISEGSIYNFNVQVYTQLAGFEKISQQQLSQAVLNHEDETRIILKGERRWLHCTSNLAWTHCFPHERRAWEQDHQQWSKKMAPLLPDINDGIEEAGGSLNPADSVKWRKIPPIIRAD